MTDRSIFEATDKFSNPEVKTAIAEYAKEHANRAPEVEYKVNAEGKPIPKKMCSCCSDSRENTPLDSGEASFIRKPGGFGTDPNKQLDDDTAIAIEQANKDGVPVFLVRQHSRCGAMNIIYAYQVHGANYVMDHYGPEFTIMAMERANLFDEVDQLLPVVIDAEGNKTRDFSYFEKRYGLPMIGDEAAKFQTCMALHQGEIDFNAVDEECKALGGTTKAVFVFNHMAENGRRYVAESLGKPMIKLPLPTEEGYEDKLHGILRLFPEEMRSKIVVESLAQQEWMVQNEASKANQADHDLSVKQTPTKSYLVSSNFQADDPYNTAKAAGEALFLRLPGGVAIKADATPKPVLGQFMELARAYKVPVFRIKQVSSSDQIDAIYDYHRSVASARQLERTRGPHFIKMAKRRANLYTTVDKKLKAYGFNYYSTKLGISVTGKYDEDFKTCMAVELGLGNYLAAKSMYDESVKTGKPLPEPVLFFEDKKAARVYDPKARSFIDLTALRTDHDYAMAATPRERMVALQVEIATSTKQYRASMRPKGNGCGCGKKHGAPSLKAGS